MGWVAICLLGNPANTRRSHTQRRRGLSLSTQERSVRAFTLAQDSIKLDVRSGWRNLEQAKLAYEIALNSVELNKRRVREQEVLSEVGRGTTIDLVDAQNDLTSAQNDLTNSLIGHTIARLEFWRDMGILYIKENGSWEEAQEGAQPAESATETVMEASPAAEAPASGAEEAPEN